MIGEAQWLTTYSLINNATFSWRATLSQIIALSSVLVLLCVCIHALYRSW